MSRGNKKRTSRRRNKPIQQQKISEQKNKESLLIAEHSERHFSGPLPPPEILVEYNEVVPNSASLIIEQFLEQGKHRRALENFVIRNDARRANWGLVAGFIVSMTSILGSFYIISLGFRIEGLAAVIISLASLVAAFFYGMYSRKKERQEKERMLLRMTRQGDK